MRSDGTSWQSPHLLNLSSLWIPAHHNKPWHAVVVRINPKQSSSIVISLQVWDIPFSQAVDYNCLVQKFSVNITEKIFLAITCRVNRVLVVMSIWLTEVALPFLLLDCYFVLDKQELSGRELAIKTGDFNKSPQQKETNVQERHVLYIIAQIKVFALTLHNSFRHKIGLCFAIDCL